MQSSQSSLSEVLCRPLELVAIMLPIYDLVNSNKAFSSFLLHDKPSEDSPGRLERRPTVIAGLHSH